MAEGDEFELQARTDTPPAAATQATVSSLPSPVRALPVLSPQTGGARSSGTTTRARGNDTVDSSIRKLEEQIAKFKSQIGRGNL